MGQHHSGEWRRQPDRHHALDEAAARQPALLHVGRRGCADPARSSGTFRNLGRIARGTSVGPNYAKVAPIAVERVTRVTRPLHPPVAQAGDLRHCPASPRSRARLENDAMDNRNALWRHVDRQQERFIALADRVWGMPEVCYTEHRSAAEHTAELRHQGFRVTEAVAGIPTAVMGDAGEGGPVIAILGEYDALPGLSQEAGRRDAETGRVRRPWPWLRSQLARFGRPAGRDRRQGLARRDRHARARSLLRLPGRGRRSRQDLHGSGRRLRRRRYRDLLASRKLLGGRAAAGPRQHPRRLHLHGARLACRRCTASRAQCARTPSNS